jgi:hypothetical protein
MAFKWQVQVPATRLPVSESEPLPAACGWPPIRRRVRVIPTRSEPESSESRVRVIMAAMTRIPPRPHPTRSPQPIPSHPSPSHWRQALRVTGKLSESLAGSPSHWQALRRPGAGSRQALRVTGRPLRLKLNTLRLYGRRRSLVSAAAPRCHSSESPGPGPAGPGPVRRSGRVRLGVSHRRPTRSLSRRAAADSSTALARRSVTQGTVRVSYSRSS